jgi:hypothetical protein
MLRIKLFVVLSPHVLTFFAMLNYLHHAKITYSMIFVLSSLSVFFYLKKYIHIVIRDRGTRLRSWLTLRYKPEGRGLDSRWSHWNFSVT